MPPQKPTSRIKVREVRKPSPSSKSIKAAPRAKSARNSTSSKRSKKGKLTQEVSDRIVKGLQMGMTQEAAAAYAGVTRDNFYAWLRAGQKPKARKDMRDFCDAVKTALDRFEAEAVAVLAKYGLDGWDAITTTKKTIKDRESGKVTGIEVTQKTERMTPEFSNIKWLLERRRDGYIPRQHIDHTDNSIAPIQVEFVNPGDVANPVFDKEESDDDITPPRAPGSPPGG